MVYIGRTDHFDVFSDVIGFGPFGGSVVTWLAKARAEQEGPINGLGETEMLFLHFSDIHFKMADVGEADDPNLALRSDIIRDVRRMREEIGRPADAILLTGDNRI